MPTTMTHYIASDVEDAILGLCRKVHNKPDVRFRLYIAGIRITAIPDEKKNATLDTNHRAFIIWTTKIKWVPRQDSHNPYRPMPVTGWKAMEETNDQGVVIATRSTVTYRLADLLSQTGNLLRQASKVEG